MQDYNFVNYDILIVQLDAYFLNKKQKIMNKNIN